MTEPTPPHQHYLGGPVFGGRVCTAERCWQVYELGLTVPVDKGAGTE